MNLYDAGGDGPVNVPVPAPPPVQPQVLPPPAVSTVAGPGFDVDQGHLAEVLAQVDAELRNLGISPLPTGEEDGTRVDHGGGQQLGEAGSPIVPPAVAPFAGKGAFTVDPTSFPVDYLTALDWIAVLPGSLDDNLLRAFRARGIRIVVWQVRASQAGVDAIREYGAVGYIAQSESPAELEAAKAIATRITVPKGLVSNTTQWTIEPGWVSMPEAYTNENPTTSPAGAYADAAARGAAYIIPIIGTYGGYSVARYGPSLALTPSYGVGAYVLEGMTPTDLDAYVRANLKTPTIAPPGDSGVGGGAGGRAGQPPGNGGEVGGEAGGSFPGGFTGLTDISSSGPGYGLPVGVGGEAGGRVPPVDRTKKAVGAEDGWYLLMDSLHNYVGKYSRRATAVARGYAKLVG